MLYFTIVRWYTGEQTQVTYKQKQPLKIWPGPHFECFWVTDTDYRHFSGLFVGILFKQAWGRWWRNEVIVIYQQSEISDLLTVCSLPSSSHFQSKMLMSAMACSSICLSLEVFLSVLDQAGVRCLCFSSLVTVQLLFVIRLFCSWGTKDKSSLSSKVRTRDLFNVEM